MSQIGEARKELARIADELRAQDDHEYADRITDIVESMMFRRTPARGRMPGKSNQITPDIKAQILKLAKSTKMHSAEIAAELGVNPGRVSEVLQGDR
jgi:hypothetical protein